MDRMYVFSSICYLNYLERVIKRALRFSLFRRFLIANVSFYSMDG